MRDQKENINQHEDKSLETETGPETTLEIVQEIHNIEIEGYQRDPIGLEAHLKSIQVIDQIIEQEMVEIILNRNPTL